MGATSIQPFHNMGKEEMDWWKVRSPLVEKDRFKNFGIIGGAWVVVILVMQEKKQSS